MTVVMFSLVPFTLAQKQHVAISPVSLRISRAFQIRPVGNLDALRSLISVSCALEYFQQPSPGWSFLVSLQSFHPISHQVSALPLLISTDRSSFFSSCLPYVTPTETSSDEVTCENVREAISRAMKVESTAFDEREVVALKQRPDLFRQRQGRLWNSSLLNFIESCLWLEQRRMEFQQMIQLVHQQVPQASLEAIRYDLGRRLLPARSNWFFSSMLETTKSVPRTIANLNERVAAAARAANKASASGSSSAMSKSSGSNNHRVTYERLKQELIEKNRQLFLNKNSNWNFSDLKILPILFFSFFPSWDQ